VSKMKRFCIIGLRLLVVLSSAVGALFVVGCAWVFWHMPRASAEPNSFIIVDAYGSSSPETPLSRIYLEAPSSVTDLKFEGASLKHQFRGVPHEQATVLLNGVAVNGSGTIAFGATRIKIDDGRIVIHDRLLNTLQTGIILLGTPSIEIRGDHKEPGPLQIILGRNGWYFEGYIHLGGRRLFTSSLTPTGGRILAHGHRLGAESPVLACAGLESS
jgi:hypothetical protein